MLIDRAGWPFILGALLVAVGVGFWFGRVWTVPFLVLAAFFPSSSAIPTAIRLTARSSCCRRPTRA